MVGVHTDADDPIGIPGECGLRQSIILHFIQWLDIEIRRCTVHSSIDPSQCVHCVDLTAWQYSVFGVKPCSSILSTHPTGDRDHLTPLSTARTDPS